jgi:putative membrane protein
MTWDWEPSVVIGCVVVVAAHLAFARRRSPLQTLSFLSGTLLLLLDLVSPLDTLSDTYLFSAHVVQHFLMALVIPPLWILGIPAPAFTRPWLARIEYALSEPVLAWSLGVGTMLAWHAPVLFNAALANPGLHIFQHLSFLITGSIFWWPILARGASRQIPPLQAIFYLFSACIACSLLGAAFTFTPPGWYPAYLNPAGDPDILRQIRGGWGLDPRSDQQLGGMLMWVPGCLVYLTAILARVARWYAAPERA